MTHHYDTLTTEDWIESETGRTEFLEWLAGESDDTLLDSVRINLIGWAPFDRLMSIEEARSYIFELAPHSPVAEMLHGRFVEYWLGTDREHDRFHRWALGRGLCGGCWT